MRSRYLVGFVAGSIIFLLSFNISGMNFIEKDPFLVRDILITPHYGKMMNSLSHYIESYTISGLADGVKIGKYLDLEYGSSKNNFLLRIFPQVSVDLDQGKYLQKKTIFSIKTKTLIDHVGVTVSFTEDEKEEPKDICVEYILLLYKKEKSHKQFEDLLKQDDTYVVKVFDAENKKLIFKKECKDKVFRYKTYPFMGRELIVLSFEKYVQLYDLKSGKKITQINADEKIYCCYIGQKKAYLILSVNNKVKVIDLHNNDRIILNKTFKNTVMGGLSIFRFLALTLCSQENEKVRFISLFDLDKKNDPLGEFELGSKNYYYGFGKERTGAYFWIMNHEADNIHIYSLDPFKRILSKNFFKEGNKRKKKIKDFKVEEIGYRNTGRNITIEFDDGSHEKYKKILT